MEPLQPPRRRMEALPWVLSIIAALLTLIPPSVIGLGSSALTLQSLEHWIAGSPDTFEALHIHWLWIPRVIAFVTPDAFSALFIFRMLIVGLTTWLFFKAATRFFDERQAVIGATMLMLNITILYLGHTFESSLLTEFLAVWMLYLFSTDAIRNHKIAALLFGLSLSIGVWPCLLLTAVITVGLNIHHDIYSLKSRETLLFFGLVLLGAVSFALLELFYFGASNLKQALLPTEFGPNGISLIAQGLIIAIFSGNVLLWAVFRRKPGSISSEFLAAFVILLMVFILNVFSREVLLHDVAIFIPCLILVALDKIESISRFATIYLVINLGLFFLLPASHIDPEIASSKLRRLKTNDEINFSYYQAADMFSYAQLREEKAGEDEARQLLSTIRLDSTLILITPGTDTWFDAGTLGAEYPSCSFGWYYGKPINLVRLNGLKDTSFMNPHPARPYLAALLEKNYARHFIDSAMPRSFSMQESERLQMIGIRGSLTGRSALIQQLIDMEFQGGVHH